MVDVADESAIAIIGMAGRFPGAENIDRLWENLQAGHEALKSLSDAELLASGIPASEFSRPGYVKAAMNVEGAEHFDAAFFGFRPGEAERLDPQKRLFLECVWEAIESAGQNLLDCGLTTGVFAGSGTSPYFLRSLAQLAGSSNSMARFQSLIETDKDHLATQTSYKFDLRGPSLAVQTACSTSLVAVHLACQSLLNMECDLALAGGVSLRLYDKGHQYEEGGILSADGHCRAFDADATGTIFGSGAGVVALKRLAQALDDRDPVWAVIRGSAINNDGSYKAGYTAPSHDGQMKVVAAALAVAGVAPRQIGLIEAHGTGTVLGDGVELAALTDVFRAQTNDARFCAIGSIKSGIGHLDTAAGVAGLIKAVLCLKHRRLVPSLNYAKPNEVIAAADSPFYVNTETRDWASDAGPRFAGVSSFGIGGTNAHVVLEESGRHAEQEPPRGPLIFPVSAKTPAALDRVSQNLAAHLARNEHAPLADVAHTLQVGRVPFEYRRVAIADHAQDAIAQLRAAADAANSGRAVGAGDLKVTFLFPGQAAQTRGFLAALYRTDVRFAALIDRCARLFAREGFDHVPDYACGENGAAATDRDARCVDQAVQFTGQYCLAQYLIELGIRPAAVLGYSLGDYAAACVAGVMSLQSAVRLVATRTRSMEASPPGAMLVAQAGEAALRDLLDGSVDLAGINGAEQCVLSGAPAPLEAIADALERRDVLYRRLPFDRAFHSRLMDDAARAVAKSAGALEFRPPALPYLSSSLGAWLGEAPGPAYWGEHLRHTVRFSAALHELAKRPAQVLLEIGPGDTLIGLARQEWGAGVPALRSMQRGAANDRSDMLRLVGALWTTGARIDWSCLDDGVRAHRTRLPTYPFERVPCPPPAGEPTALAAAATEGARDVGGGVPADAAAAPALQPAIGTPPPGPARYLKAGAPGFMALSGVTGLADGAGPPAGKLSRDALNERVPLAAYVSPDGAMAQAIAQLWSDVLNIDRIGMSDSFFDLGGDSQRAVQIVRGVREKLNGRCSMRFLYEEPVLSGFVDRVVRAMSDVEEA